MSDPPEVQSHRNILSSHERRISKLEAYQKLIAAEATILIPLVLTILVELWRR